MNRQIVPAVSIIAALFFATGAYPENAGVFISKYNYDNDGRQWYLNQDTAGYVNFYTSPNGSTHELLTSQGGGYLNDWVHVAGVRDGSTKLLYINGLFDNTQSTAGVVTGRASKVYAGGYDHPVVPVSRPFNGVIDDIRVYDRALSAGEVWQLYQDGSGSGF